MSLPFLNTAPGYDEELRNSVFLERWCTRRPSATRSAPRWPWRCCRGQDEAGIASAASIGASMGAGLLEANRAGGPVKRVDCGWAAHCGVAAADLAQEREAGIAARTLALPDAQSVEDLTALLTAAGER